MRLLCRENIRGFYRASVLSTFILVVGCSDIDGGSTLSDNVIVFEDCDFKESVTRGSMTTSFSSGDSFAVFAYTVDSGEAFGHSSTEKLMADNTRVTLSDEGVWGYSPSVFWPEWEWDTHFISYSPHVEDSDAVTSAVVNSATSAVTISYSTPTNCSEQSDLIIATTTCSTYDILGVGLSFEHALSAISFQVQGNEYRTLIGVTVKNIYGTADLTYDGSTTQWSWGSHDNIQDFSAGINSTNPNTDPEVATTVTTNEGYILAIPQTLPSTAVVEISYCEYGSTEAIAKTLALPDNSVWVKGGQYIYSITLMDNITIELSDWSTDWSQSIEVSDETYNSYEVDDYDYNSESSDSITDVDDVFGVEGYDGEKTTSDEIPSSADDGFEVDDNYDNNYSYTDTI